MRQRITRRRPKPLRAEQAIQMAVCVHLRWRAVPGLVWWHTPNGGQRSPVEAAILKGMGVRAGVSDLILVHRGQIYALELKAAGGLASQEQRRFLDEIAAAGAFTGIAHGLDEAIAALEHWGLLRGTVMRDFRAAQAAE